MPVLFFIYCTEESLALRRLSAHASLTLLRPPASAFCGSGVCLCVGVCVGGAGGQAIRSAHVPATKIESKKTVLGESFSTLPPRNRTNPRSRLSLAFSRSRSRTQYSDRSTVFVAVVHSNRPPCCDEDQPRPGFQPM